MHHEYRLCPHDRSDRAAGRGVWRARRELTRGQVCCGALQAHSGDVERARELARQNIAAFGDGDAPIVVNAAGCGAMLKHYGQLLPDEPRAAALRRAGQDVSEFLAQRQPTAPTARGRAARSRCRTRVTCCTRSASPQRRARCCARFLGWSCARWREPEICCGSAGVYNVSHPEMSAELQQRKCANIAATGCEVVVTGNPGCFVQIQAGLPSDIRCATSSTCSPRRTFDT